MVMKFDSFDSGNRAFNLWNLPLSHGTIIVIYEIMKCESWNIAFDSWNRVFDLWVLALPYSNPWNYELNSWNHELRVRTYSIWLMKSGVRFIKPCFDLGNHELNAWLIGLVSWNHDLCDPIAQSARESQIKNCKNNCPPNVLKIIWK